MERVNLILNNHEFKFNLLKICDFEKDRIFCKHDIEHFLSVSRIAYIINLENEHNINKEIIYALGLLHDIGRGEEYESGIPHNEAGAEIAERILKNSKFNDDEVIQILNVIKNHRNYNGDNSLINLIYKADKLSRNCFNCNAYAKCKWEESKRNLGIEL